MSSVAKLPIPSIRSTCYLPHPTFALPALSSIAFDYNLYQSRLSMFVFVCMLSLRGDMTICYSNPFKSLLSSSIITIIIIIIISMHYHTT
jgi:hypothetical protein